MTITNKLYILAIGVILLCKVCITSLIFRHLSLVVIRNKLTILTLLWLSYIIVKFLSFETWVKTFPLVMAKASSFLRSKFLYWTANF